MRDTPIGRLSRSTVDKSIEEVFCDKLAKCDLLFVERDGPETLRFIGMFLRTCFDQLTMRQSKIALSMQTPLVPQAGPLLPLPRIVKDNALGGIPRLKHETGGVPAAFSAEILEAAGGLDRPTPGSGCARGACDPCRRLAGGNEDERINTPNCTTDKIGRAHV